MPIPPVLRAAHVRRSPADTFRLFTDQIGAWWPLGTHGLFGARSGGVSFVDGVLVERSGAGETTVWGEVLTWEPPDRLVLAWHPGRTEGPHGVVEVTFTGDEDGTRVEIAHRGWDAFGAGAMAARRDYTGPSAWGGLLDQFGDLADRHAGGAELDGLDELAELAAAYEAFFAEAALGGFGPPTGAEWTAEQVVAHVAVNDDGLAAVCRTLLRGLDASFDNAPSNDRPVLDALVTLARTRAETVRLLLGRLDTDQLSTAVPCHLVDHGEVVLDRPMPWGQLATRTQAGFHLPLHTEQLRALRAG